MADDMDGAFASYAAATLDGLLERQPEWATGVGDHRHDDRLTVGAAGYYEEASRWAGDRLAELAAIDADRLSPQYRPSFSAICAGRGREDGAWLRRQRQRHEAQGRQARLASACRRAQLDDVTPHTLRHTAATWLMQAGKERSKAADFLAMTEETLQRIYEHHHPAFLRDEAAALNVRPRNVRGIAGNKPGVLRAFDANAGQKHQ